jgi:hypothetical protein
MKFRLDQTKDGELALSPFDEAALRFLNEQIDGEPVEVEILHPRDMVEHRRIMAQIGDVAKALHRTQETVRAELLYATGNFTFVGEMTGMPPMIAVNSMSRHSMKDHELHVFWDEAREIVMSRLLPKIEDDAERTRLAEMLSPQPA